MKRCPKCGGKNFYVVAHVTQGWKVDEHGNFVDVVEDCIETLHEPNNDDIWECWKCGYHAIGNKFEVGVKI